MTDRVPVTLFMSDQGHFLSQVYPELDSRDYIKCQLKVVELQKQLGCDVFVRLLNGTIEPVHIIYGGVDVTRQTENWEVKTEDIRNGDTLIKKSIIRTPDGTLTQEFSFNEIRKGTLMFACTKPPIEKEADLDICIKYEPRVTDEWKARVKKDIEIVKEAVGDDGVVGTWSPHGPFNTGSLLIKLDELYQLFLSDPPYFDKLMNFCIERTVGYTKAIDEAGVDVHHIGANVAGGFIGKKFFDEYILPYEKKYMDIVQENGTPGMYHNCGEIMNLLESYKNVGVKIVEPFSPPPLGDTNLAKAKELVNGDYVMLAGIDHVNVIQKGTVNDVKRVTEQTMNIGKPCGKFIFQPVDFLEYGTPIENVEAFVKTGLEHAGY